MPLRLCDWSCSVQRGEGFEEFVPPRELRP
jgi:hypothetical protein